MIKYPFKIQKHNDDGEYFLIECLNYEGGFSQAETFEEAISNAQEVIDLLLDYALRNDSFEPPKNVEGDNIYYIQPSIEYAVPAMIKEKRN